MTDKIKKEILRNEITNSKGKTVQKKERKAPHDEVKNTELSFALEEMEHIIAYLCRTGGEINTHEINVCIKTKHKYGEEGSLLYGEEIEFWNAYRLVMESIKPASLASIQETSPSQLWIKKHPKVSAKVKRIPIYYGATVCLIIILTIILQVYYMIGIDVLQKTYELFNQRGEVSIQISKLKKLEKKSDNHVGNASNEMIALQRQEAKLDQEFDANRILMFRWNKVWQKSSQPDVSFSIYDEYKYSTKRHRLTQAIEKIEEKLQLTRQPEGLAYSPEYLEALEKELAYSLKELNLFEGERKLAISRHLFFSGRLSAVYMVNLLEGHILPLLFGCLGAFTLVLRSMHDAFANGTFTLKSCLDYNLRILLGGVIGISSGMFIGDNQGIPNGEYTAMVVAFLVGYNVEIMFSIMDSLAQKLAIKGSRSGRDNGKIYCKNAMSSPDPQMSRGSRTSSDPRGSRVSRSSRTSSDPQDPQDD